jgi:hypothetical protein
MHAGDVADAPVQQTSVGPPALVDEEHAVHTQLDDTIYGSDEVWNQQLFTGGSPAELLQLACASSDNPKVPKWWYAKLEDITEILTGPREEVLNKLRQSVFKTIQNSSRLLHKIARAEEKRVRPVMVELENRSNGELVGMEFSIKEVHSIERKLLFESSQSSKNTLQQVMNSRMTDGLRYTILYPTKSYCKQTKLLLDFLIKENYFMPNELRNYWETGHAYDGLNCSFFTDEVEAGGILFELQVHTPESFDVKQHKSHSLYELWRCVDHPQRKYMVYTQMVNLFDRVPRPPGDLMSMGTLSRKSSPEPGGYQEWLVANPKDLVAIKKPESSWNEYFGVTIQVDMDNTSVLTDTIGYSSPELPRKKKGKFDAGKYKNPMVDSGANGDTAMAMPGSISEPTCMDKFARAFQNFCGCSLPCYQRPALNDRQTPLVSAMREEKPGIQKNPMFDNAMSDAADDAPAGKYAFIRHGEAEHNVLFRKGDVAKGVEILDPPLTGKGRRQVEALRKYIREEGLTFDVVYCSCLTRALQTCQIIFEGLASDLPCVPLLCTLSGIRLLVSHGMDHLCADIQPSRVVVTPLQTETGVDVPGDDRVGGAKAME